MKTKYFWLQQDEKNQELRIEKIRGTVNPADLMTKHLDGKRLVMLCELLNIKQVDGRPRSAPKLTIATEKISRDCRALAAMTNDMDMKSEAIQETWIDGYGMDWWTAASWIQVGIVTCCILIRLVLLQRKSGRVTEMVDDETQTLEEGKSDQIFPSRILITKNGKAAHCRDDSPLLLKSYSNQTLSWCSHCAPSDILEKNTWRRRVGI